MTFRSRDGIEAALVDLDLISLDHCRSDAPRWTDRPARARRQTQEKSPKKAEVTPPEDLMRAHGVLDRLLLPYVPGKCSNFALYTSGQTNPPRLL
jgi:hypothetical protein